MHIRGSAHDFIQDDAEEAPVSRFRIPVYAAGEIDERADLQEGILSLFAALGHFFCGGLDVAEEGYTCLCEEIRQHRCFFLRGGNFAEEILWWESVGGFPQGVGI